MFTYKLGVGHGEGWTGELSIYVIMKVYERKRRTEREGERGRERESERERERDRE